MKKTLLVIALTALFPLTAMAEPPSLKQLESTNTMTAMTTDKNAVMESSKMKMDHSKDSMGDKMKMDHSKPDVDMKKEMGKKVISDKM